MRWVFFKQKQNTVPITIAAVSTTAHLRREYHNVNLRRTTRNKYVRHFNDLSYALDALIRLRLFAVYT